MIMNHIGDFFAKYLFVFVTFYRESFKTNESWIKKIHILPIAIMGLYGITLKANYKAYKGDKNDTAKESITHKNS